MSCYFRHMKDVLAEAGIVVNPSNRKAVDHALYQIAGVSHDHCHCPEVWKILKQRLATEEGVRELGRELREAMR